MNLIVIPLIFLYATHIHASTKLAELKTAHIEVDSKLVEFTEIYRSFSTLYKAIYKFDEDIYELRATTPDRNHVSIVLRFYLTEIPIMTRGRIVLKGNLEDLPQTFILHCTLTIENARKIYVDHLPAGILHPLQYQLKNFWKIIGMSPINPSKPILYRMTNKATGIFIDSIPPENTRRSFSIKSVEGDEEPFIVFSTSNFGVVTYRGETTTKVILVIDELQGDEELKYYYGLELENAEGDAFVEIISNDASHRPDLSQKIADKHYSNWFSY